jgi:hypothetical protein
MVVASAASALACTGDPRSITTGPGPGPGPGPAPAPHPIVVGSWAYYGTALGLSDDPRDVSADEGGNVYVAGGDAIYAKVRTAETFLRFDADNAGLTKNCNDAADIANWVPAKPFYQCNIISVGGGAPGVATIGFEGFGAEADQGTPWAQATGGADVVAFDAAQGKLTRTRHVFIASPPHVVCNAPGGETTAGTCSDPNNYWWVNGRRLFRKVMRIVVNHDRSSPEYGDVWMGGGHATFAVLLANAAQRGWRDLTDGFGPDWTDAKDVWEHLHPAITDSMGIARLGAGYALSIDPRDGTVWGSNGIRTTWVTGYGPNLSATDWWMGTFYDLWTDSGDNWYGPTNDQVRSVSHCADGTLWVGSATHGLARIATDGTVSYLDLPDPATLADSVTAVACDPADSSLWIGLGSGGVMRLSNGAFQRVDTAGAPAFANQPVASIQIDRWSTPRTVYVAFAATRDATQAVLSSGGVGAYTGP